MSKKFFILNALFTCCLIIICENAIVIASTSTNTNRTCLIIHSYDYDYAWTTQEEQGILKALEDNFNNHHNWKIKKFTLNSKKLNGTKLKERVMKVRKEVQTINAHAVILTDDFATQEFLDYFKHNKIPTSVAGINRNLEDYGYKNSDEFITGSLERYTLPPSLKILKKIRPDLEHIFFISDDSLTGKAMLNDYLKQINEGNLYKTLGFKSYQSVVTNNYELLKQKISQLNPTKTILVLVTYYTLKDKNGNHVDYNTIDDWIYNNTKLLDIGSSTFQIKNGRFLSLASSAFEVGYYSANLLFKSIREGKTPKHYGIRKELPLQLTFNFQKAKHLNIKLPLKLISYSKSINHFAEYQ